MSDSRRLSINEISFHNFDGLMQDVQRALQNVGIWSWQPSVEVIQNGIIVPEGAAPLPGSLYKFQGGILDSAGQPILSAHLRRSGLTVVGGLAQPMTIIPEHELDEEMIYLGWLQAYHYGLFLVESLARSWYLREIDPSIRVAFHQIGGYPPEGASRRMLDLMGIPSERMIVPKALTRVRKLYIPDSMFELYYGAHEDMVDPFREVAKTIMSGASKEVSDQPVYLSRRRLTSDRRTIIGETELEEILRANGFLVTYPETMSLDEQVRLFNEHTDVFACVGSAAHTVLFALGQIRLHLLTDEVPVPEFFLIPRISGAELTLINCLVGEKDHTFPRMLDLPPLVEYLMDRGFLQKDARLEIDALQALLREQYHEALVGGVIRKATAAGAALGATVERAALTLSTTSWPVSWGLARYYAVRDQAQAGEMAAQFVALLAEETDAERVSHHFREIVMGAIQVVGATATACGATAANRLVEALVDRDLVNATVHVKVQRIAAEARLKATDDQGQGFHVSSRC